MILAARSRYYYRFHPPVRCQRGFSLFELVVVIVVIGLLASVATKYYIEAINNARRAGLTAQAHSFAAAVSGVYAAAWVQRVDLGSDGFGDAVILHNVPIYLNEHGWPVGTDRGQSAASNSQTARKCAQLWSNLLQNPAPASIEGRSPFGSRSYHISVVNGDRCRYELYSKQPRASYYFDYSPVTGRVQATVPPLS